MVKIIYTSIFCILIQSITACKGQPVVKNTTLQKQEDVNPGSINTFSFDSITSFSVNVVDLDCKGIPDSVWQMKNIKHISIQGEDCDYGPVTRNGKNICCGIKEISPQIGNLTELESIDMRINPGISSFPDAIKNCKKLRSIDMTDGGIENIENLIALENLEELYLFGCNLEKLPKDIGRLKKLKHLGLTGNWQLTEDEVNRVKKALPHCEIAFER